MSNMFISLYLSVILLCKFAIKQPGRLGIAFFHP
jgi:hypothetical protein